MLRRAYPSLTSLETRIDQNVGIQKFHELGAAPPFRLAPNSASMCLAIGDVRSHTDESFALPIGDQFRARLHGYLFTASRSQEAQDVV